VKIISIANLARPGANIWSGTARIGRRNFLWFYWPRNWLHVQEQDGRNPRCWMNIDPPAGTRLPCSEQCGEPTSERRFPPPVCKGRRVFATKFAYVQASPKARPIISEIRRSPGFSEMLLTLIILTLAVVAIICACAMFVKYLREEADDDGNSKPPPA
jgi:hypothetical protein